MDMTIAQLFHEEADAMVTILRVEVVGLEGWDGDDCFLQSGFHGIEGVSFLRFRCDIKYTLREGS